MLFVTRLPSLVGQQPIIGRGDPVTDRADMGRTSRRRAECSIAPGREVQADRCETSLID